MGGNFLYAYYTQDASSARKTFFNFTTTFSTSWSRKKYIIFSVYCPHFTTVLQSWTKHLETFFNSLAQFVFTTSETEIDYYYQKVNVRVASRVAERLKKLVNFKKILEMLGFDGEYQSVHPKAKFWRFLVKNCKKSAVKHSIEKPILLDFVNLSPTFCPRFSDKTDFDF